jgi:hypothetical protein
MATMLPNDIQTFTTDGEGTFYRFLQTCAKPDNRYLAWYLLERLGENRLADPLAVRLKERRYRPTLLAPGQPKGDAPSDPRWRVIPNEAVEVEF